MIGAIIGDIIGSTYEFNAIKTKEFELFPKGSKFTDDTVLSMAIAKSIIDNEPYLDNIVKFGREYPHAGYGGFFRRWLKGDNHTPYNSWGNGSAMRVSPIGFAFDNEEEVLKEAKECRDNTQSYRGYKRSRGYNTSYFYGSKRQKQRGDKRGYFR